MHTQLQKFLRDKGVIEVGSSPTLTPLSGGFWNDVYRVKTPSQDLIVKVMQEDNDSSRFYPNQPKQEMEALDLLASLDIAPQLVDYYPLEENTILIYNFASGTMLTKELNITDRKPLLRLVAELFSKQHGLDKHSIDSISNQRNFRHLPQNPIDMISLADKLLIGLDNESNIEHLHKYKSVLKNSEKIVEPKPVFLHTDAWAGNFIFNKVTEELKLIDWQCPAIGDASFDIWTFAFLGYNILEGERLFDEEEKQFFIDTYISLSDDHGFEERFEYFEPYYAYQIAAHSCQRIVALARDNPEASQKYQEIFNLQIITLEESLSKDL